MRKNTRTRRLILTKKINWVIHNTTQPKPKTNGFVQIYQLI